MYKTVIRKEFRVYDVIFWWW